MLASGSGDQDISFLESVPRSQGLTVVHALVKEITSRMIVQDKILFILKLAFWLTVIFRFQL